MSKAQGGSPGAAFSEDVERVTSLITLQVAVRDCCRCLRYFFLRDVH